MKATLEAVIAITFQSIRPEPAKPMPRVFRMGN